MKSNAWRTAPRVYIHAETGEPVHKKKKRKPKCAGFRPCIKMMARKDNVRYSAVIFNSGTVMIGFDAWRLSNNADNCSYPLLKFVSQKEAELDGYIFSEAPEQKWFD